MAEPVMEKTLPHFECVQKVQGIPLVTSTTGLLLDYYARAKGMHPLISRTLGYCENTTQSAVTRLIPWVSTFEKPLHMADGYACSGLDYIGKTFPVVKKEPQEILQTTMKPAVDRIQGVKEYGQEKVQTVLKKGQEQADFLLDNKPTKLALDGLQTGLKGANDFLNQYYPLEARTEEDTDEKITQQPTVETPKNPTGQAMLVFTLLVQLNTHIYSVMRNQVTKVHELTMQKLNQLTGVITLMETAKAEGKAGEGLVGRAKELSGSLLHFYTETAHSVVAKFPGLLNTYIQYVRAEVQQLFDVFAKAETISDIPTNMLTFAKTSIQTTQSTLVKMIEVIKSPEEESAEKKQK